MAALAAGPAPRRTRPYAAARPIAAAFLVEHLQPPCSARKLPTNRDIPLPRHQAIEDRQETGHRPPTSPMPLARCAVAHVELCPCRSAPFARLYKEASPASSLHTILIPTSHTHSPPPAGAARAPERRNCSRSRRLGRRRAPLIQAIPGSAACTRRTAVVFHFVRPHRRPRWSPGTPPLHPHRPR